MTKFITALFHYGMNQDTDNLIYGRVEFELV